MAVDPSVIMRVSLLAANFVLAVVSVPMMLGRVPPNQLYGFRTRLTLSKAEIWYSANAFAGGALFIAALVSTVALCLMPSRLLARVWVPLLVFAAPLAISVVASFLYIRRVE